MVVKVVDRAVFATIYADCSMCKASLEFSVHDWQEDMYELYVDCPDCGSRIWKEETR